MSEVIVNYGNSPLTFIEYLKSENDKDSVWYYFLREKAGQFALCKNEHCKQVLKTGGGSTSTLHGHLKSKHQTVLKKVRAPNEGQLGQGDIPTKRPRKITEYFSQPEESSLSATISRMAARDGFPISVFCTSPDLRRAIKALGLKEELPKSPHSMRKMILKYAQSIRNLHLDQICKLKSEGTKFCVTFDEWTSSKNNRFMNLILHGPQGQIWNFGLLRIVGSLTSENAVKLVSEKLLEYRISLVDDIISIMTDGTSVMTKIAKLSPTSQQLCLAHGIQLAVEDVLYPKNKKTPDIAHDAIDTKSENGDNIGPRLEGDDSASFEGETDESEDSDGDDIGPMSEEDDSTSFEVAVDGTINDVSHAEVSPTIAKVRKLVKMFRRSPLKNETLQKYVHADMNKNLQLILDCKTRWSSLFHMLERFHLLRNCVRKSLIDLKLNIEVEEREINLIKDVVDALGPLRVSVEAVCRRDATLLTADAALNFALNKLEDLDSAIAQELLEAFRRRIKERRTDYSGILQYLHSGSLEMDDNYDALFYIPGRAKVASKMKDLLSRLHAVEKKEDEGDEPIPEHEMVEVEGRKKKSHSALHPELDAALSEIETRAHSEKCQPTKTLLNTIKKEMLLFEAGGSRGHHLQVVFNHLKIIKPTSVESERAFSSAGYICNKICSRLRDDTLSELCFLRSYFQLLASTPNNA